MGSDDAARKKGSGCCWASPRVVYVLAAGLVALAALLAYASTQTLHRQYERAERTSAAGRNWAEGHAADSVWHGVTTVQASVPQLCRDGSELVCAQYQALVVLGGGPANADGVLPEWVKRRCDVAVELYHCCAKALLKPGGGQRDHRSLVIITTSAGTIHTPSFMDGDGFPVTEARKSAQYMITHGVDPVHILEETASWDTLGNAWFTRIMHTDVIDLQRLLVITSDFHLPRSQAIFEWVFALPQAGSSQASGRCASFGVQHVVNRCLVALGLGPDGLDGGWGGSSTCSPYRLGFMGVSDTGIDMIANRTAREVASLRSFRQVSLPPTPMPCLSRVRVVMASG